MSKVISFINRKGGVGKTTSAVYTAMCLHEAGKQVTGLDLDPERSLVNWKTRAELPFEVIGGDLATLEQTLKGLKGYVVIDSPPNSRDAIEDIPILSDEVIIPLSPTELDLNRLVGTAKAVLRAERERGITLGSVLLVRYKKGLNLARAVSEALEGQGFPVLDNKIRSLTRYETMGTPSYLDEYQAALKEIEVL